MTQKNKPIIETIINTSALAITAYGVVQITTGNQWGYVALFAGLGIEWFKYWGRKKQFW